jgi:outer membrane lipoprotein carrier protein
MGSFAAVLTMTTLLRLDPATVRRTGPQDPDPRVIVDKAAKAYAALRSFRASFRQVIADSMIGTYESQGTLTQAGPSQLVMRFSDPKDDAIVMDGEHLWVYTPSTTPGQVIRMKVPTDPTYGPNVLAWILTRPADRYQSRYLRSDAVAGRSVDVIALVPIDKSLPFTEATVWLDQYDALPRRLEIRERGGTRRTLVFTAVEVNRRISADQFRFTVQSGVRVIDQ